ncbi:hypothetical protein Vretimale_13868 [Volvox reticuliferus]|uniref:Uncharacterized protein n=1 Tax=Volvox reticuliferus TaxID=1737510 RepID=A0A8J4CWJ6_9CHLO|nr:hypothetical protein Vretifemale_17822 [Volvox reticuliferus]GIM10139.1 hypothetical protein Vretimale_13868 [Volvox reticuliferus]
MTRRDGQWLSAPPAPAVVDAVDSQEVSESLMPVSPPAASSKRCLLDSIGGESEVEGAVPCPCNPPAPVPSAVHGGDDAELRVQKSACGGPGGGSGGDCGGGGGGTRVGPPKVGTSSQRLQGGAVDEAVVSVEAIGDCADGSGSGANDGSVAGGGSGGGGAMVVNLVLPLEGQCSEVFLRSEQLAKLLHLNGDGDPRVDSDTVVSWVGPGVETLALKLLADGEREGEPWQLVEAKLHRDTAAGGWWLKGIGSWIKERNVTRRDALLLMNTAHVTNRNHSFIHDTGSSNGRCCVMGMSLLREAHSLTSPPSQLPLPTTTAEQEMAKSGGGGGSGGGSGGVARIHAAVRMVVDPIRRSRGRPRKPDTQTTRLCSLPEWHRKEGERTAGPTWDETCMKVLCSTDVASLSVHLPKQLENGVFAGALEEQKGAMHKASVKLIVRSKGPERAGGSRGDDGGSRQLEWEVPVNRCGQVVSLEHAWPVLFYFKAQVGDVLVFQPGQDLGSFFVEIIKKPAGALQVDASAAAPMEAAAAAAAAVEEPVAAATVGAAEGPAAMTAAAAAEIETAAAAGAPRRDMEGQAAGLLTTWSACPWSLLGSSMQPRPVFASDGRRTVAQAYPPSLPPQQQQNQRQRRGRGQKGEVGAGGSRSAVHSDQRLQRRRAAAPRPPLRLDEPHEAGLMSHRQYPGVVVEVASVIGWLLGGDPRPGDPAATGTAAATAATAQAVRCHQRTTPTEGQKGGDILAPVQGRTDSNYSDDERAAKRQRRLEWRRKNHKLRKRTRNGSRSSTVAAAGGRSRQRRQRAAAHPSPHTAAAAAPTAAAQRAAGVGVGVGVPAAEAAAAEASAATARPSVHNDREPQTNHPPSPPQQPSPAASQQQHQHHHTQQQQQQQQQQPPVTLEFGTGTATFKVLRGVLPIPDYPRLRRRHTNASTPLAVAAVDASRRGSPIKKPSVHVPPQPAQRLWLATEQKQNLSADVKRNEATDIDHVEGGATAPAPGLRPMGPSRSPKGPLPKFSRPSGSVDFLHVLADVAIRLAEGDFSPDSNRPGLLRPMGQDPWVDGAGVTGFRRTGVTMDKALAGKGRRRKSRVGLEQGLGQRQVGGTDRGRGAMATSALADVRPMEVNARAITDTTTIMGQRLGGSQA